MTERAQTNTKVMALRRMSGADFLALGTENLVFVKQVAGTEGQTFGVFSASGEALGTAETYELAEATALQNDFAVATLH
ncbi:MAG: hypothetical protein VW268_12235 [Rhodospirillaceae bacterium]